MGHMTSLYIPGVDGETLLIALDQMGISISLGSACQTGSLKPSRALLNMSLSPVRAKNSIRISLGRTNTPLDIQKFLQALLLISSS